MDEIVPLPGALAMKFLCLLPVRDEADIIGQCLRSLLVWADRVFVFDTGSIDETWEIVQHFARHDRRITPMGKQPVYFSETHVRGYMFHHARKDMRDGDWFLRVDADEFHHISPREFVNAHMQKHETLAYHQYYDFRLLQSESNAWLRGDETLQDRSRPIEERRRYFTVSSYSEPRLCRYRSTMQWPETVSFPYNAGYVARSRLPIRHYPHRDPEQLKRRCRLRSIMMADPLNRSNWSRPDLHHWIEKDWTRFITSDTDPALLYWRSGSELPPQRDTGHIKPLSIRLVQRLVHKYLLRALDTTRRRFPNAGQPLQIPDTIQSLLKRNVALSGNSGFQNFL